MANERPLELYTTTQALDKRKRKKKKHTCFKYKKEGHFAKECQSKPRRLLKERINKVTRGRTKFMFTTQYAKSQSDVGSSTSLLDMGASQHMVSSKTRLFEVEPLDIPTIIVLGNRWKVGAMHQI